MKTVTFEKPKFEHDLKWYIFNEFYGSKLLTRCLTGSTVVDTRWSWFSSQDDHIAREQKHVDKITEDERQRLGIINRPRLVTIVEKTRLMAKIEAAKAKDITANQVTYFPFNLSIGKTMAIILGVAALLALIF